MQYSLYCDLLYGNKEHLNRDHIIFFKAEVQCFDSYVKYINPFNQKKYINNQY